MKHLVKISLFIIAFAISSTTAEAQFLNRLKRAVNNAVEDAIIDKAAEKTREETNKAIDKAIEKEEKKRKTEDDGSEEDASEDANRASDMMNALLGGMEGKYEDSYEFSSFVSMEYEQDGDKGIMDMYFGDNAIRVVNEDQKAQYIQDYSNNSMITLNEKDKTGHAISMKMISNLAKYATEEKMEDIENMKVEQTGQKKTILGYDCELYIISNDKSKTEAWIAKDAPVDMKEYLKAFESISKKAVSWTEKLNGFNMESTSYEKGKKISTSKVLKLEKKSSSIDLSGYKIGAK